MSFKKKIRRRFWKESEGHALKFRNYSYFCTYDFLIQFTFNQLIKTWIPNLAIFWLFSFAWYWQVAVLMNQHSPCSVTPATGTGNGTISIEVSGNIAKDRTGTIVIYCNGIQTNININQKALPEGQELAYRIPVIFHVL